MKKKNKPIDKSKPAPVIGKIPVNVKKKVVTPPAPAPKTPEPPKEDPKEFSTLVAQALSRS